MCFITPFYFRPCIISSSFYLQTNLNIILMYWPMTFFFKTSSLIQTDFSPPASSHSPRNRILLYPYYTTTTKTPEYLLIACQSLKPLICILHWIEKHLQRLLSWLVLYHANYYFSIHYRNTEFIF